jgi:hypothetical protein
MRSSHCRYSGTRLHDALVKRYIHCGRDSGFSDFPRHIKITSSPSLVGLVTLVLIRTL